MNETRDNIIKKSAELFNEVGIRSCSIDDICRALGMSKKTFYQYFDTKDTLVEAILRRHEEHIEQLVHSNKKSPGVSALHVMVHFMEQMEKMKDVRRKPALLFDLKKYYPLLFEQHLQTLARINKEYLTWLVAQGKAEGDFRQSVDVELCAKLLSDLNQATLNDLQRLGQYDRFADLSVFTIDLIIRGLVSEQGLCKIEKSSIE